MASSQQKFESDLPVREFPIEDGEEEEPPIAFLHLDLQRPLTSTSTFGANSRSNRMQMQRGQGENSAKYQASYEQKKVW